MQTATIRVDNVDNAADGGRRLYIEVSISGNAEGVLKVLKMLVSILEKVSNDSGSNGNGHLWKQDI